MSGEKQTWRDVYPGEWRYDGVSYIWSRSLRGGETTPVEVRGWGYLTGSGHGALGLHQSDAERIQAEVGHLIAAAPDLLEALVEFSREYDGFEDGNGDPCPVLAKARAALAKARQSTPAPDCDGEGE